MAVAKPLHLRLFLEGIEVPVVAAQISINTNAPATAAVQILPLDIAQNLLPRTIVHLFFLDTSTGHEARKRTTNKAQVSTNVRGTYRLLYSGEVVGFSYVQSPVSRGLILQCVDFSNYWDSAQATAISYGATGNLFTNQAAVYGSDTQLFDDIVNDPSSVLVSWIHTPPGPMTEGLKNVGGLAGGIIKMMEAMGGVPGHARGINDFFTVAELRCRLLQQVAAEENDNTASRVLSSQVFMEWLKNGLQCMGGQVSFRDMMKLLFSHIYYEFVPNPAAKFEVQIKGATKTVPGGTFQLAQSPLAQSALSHLATAVGDLADIDDSTTDVTSMVNAASGALSEVKSADADLASLQTQIAASSSQVSSLRSTLKNAINDLSSFLIRADHSNGGGRLVIIRQNLNSVEDDINGLKSTVTVPAQPVSYDTTQRLKTQIVRPDCWFSAPPVCNIIFPEQFTQLSYDRNWLAETTRVIVQEFDTLIGSDALLNAYYVAPSFGAASVDLNKTMKNAASYRTLLPHERHTGILVKSEMLPNTCAVNVDSASKKLLRSDRATWCHRAALFHFFTFRYMSRQAGLAGKFNPFLVCGFPALIVRQPYNINLDEVKKDIQKQKMYGDATVTNAKIIEYINDNYIQLNAPSQLVGMVAGLNHSVDQSGGTTSASMHHVRSHLGSDDAFLGIYLKALSTTPRTVKTILSYRKTALIGNQLRQLMVNLTPQGPAPATPTTSVTKASTTSAPSTVATQTSGSAPTQSSATNSIPSSQVVVSTPAAPPPPLCVAGSIDGVQGDPSGGPVYIPSKSGKVGIGSKTGVYGSKGGVITGIQVLPPYTRVQVGNLGLAYPNIALYESVPIPTSENIPIEEVIRPAWFSLSYRNDRIGTDIYDNFFGCQSILDQLMVEGLGGEPLNLPSSSGDPDIPSNNATDATPDEVVAALQADAATRAEISIQKAVNLIGYLYAQVRSQNLDVDDFIRSYTNRPIATIDDIFGSGEGALLRFTVNPVDNTVTPYLEGDDPFNPTLPVQIGFHSVAVHPDLVGTVPSLTGLVVDPTTGFTRYQSVGKSAPIPVEYDVRPAKKAAVQAYAVALLSSGRAFRG